MSIKYILGLWEHLKKNPSVFILFFEDLDAVSPVTVVSDIVLRLFVRFLSQTGRGEIECVSVLIQSICSWEGLSSRPKMVYKV